MLAIVSLDIVLKFNSKKIIHGYLKEEFFFDWISFLGLLLEMILPSPFESFGYQIIKMFFFFKYPVLHQLTKKIEEIINFDEKMIAIISLLKLFIKMLFLSHFIACLWCCLPYWNPDQNWMISRNILDKSFSEKYQISLYWALVTIATIGYGDIVPQNQNEYSFTLGVVVIGSIFFGYSLTSIASIFSELEKDKLLKKLKYIYFTFNFYLNITFRQNLHILNKYLKKNKIDFETQLQIKKYMDFLWNIEELQGTEKEREIFSKLSLHLKEKVLLQTYGKILFRMPAFSKNFSTNFLIKVLSLMKPIHLDPDSIVYNVLI